MEIVIVVLIVEVTVFPVSSGTMVVVVGVFSVVNMVEVDVRKQANIKYQKSISLEY